MSDFSRNRSESSPPRATIQTNFSRFSSFFTLLLYQSAANTLKLLPIRDEILFFENLRLNHVCVSLCEWKCWFFKDVKGSNMREELCFIKYFCNYDVRETKIFPSIFCKKNRLNRKIFASLVFMYEIFILLYFTGEFIKIICSIEIFFVSFSKILLLRIYWNFWFYWSFLSIVTARKRTLFD